MCFYRVYFPTRVKSVVAEQKGKTFSRFFTHTFSERIRRELNNSRERKNNFHAKAFIRFPSNNCPGTYALDKTFSYENLGGWLSFVAPLLYYILLYSKATAFFIRFGFGGNFRRNEKRCFSFDNLFKVRLLG